MSRGHRHACSVPHLLLSPHQGDTLGSRKQRILQRKLTCTLPLPQLSPVNMRVAQQGCELEPKNADGSYQGAQGRLEPLVGEPRLKGGPER